MKHNKYKNKKLTRITEDEKFPLYHFALGLAFAKSNLEDKKTEKAVSGLV